MIPDNLILSVVADTSALIVVVTAVATIGDWTTLSILYTLLEFCFLEVKEWEVPTPTAVISK